MSKEQASVKQVKVTQVKSAIGRNFRQREILIGLGLGKLNRSKNINYTNSIKGMIDKVKHLLIVEIL